MNERSSIVNVLEKKGVDLPPAAFCRMYWRPNVCVCPRESGMGYVRRCAAFFIKTD